MRRDEAQYDVRELRLHGGHGGLAGVDAGHVPEEDPRLSFLARVHHVVQGGRVSCWSVVVLAQPMSALRPGLLRQDGVCLARVYDLHQHVQGATVHAEGDRECRGLPRVALLLSLLDVAAAPPSLTQELAGGLVDVRDAVCADSVLVHQPAQLDEEPVRVCVLLLRAMEFFHALGDFLVPQLKCMPRRSCLTHFRLGRTSCPLCVKPFVHQAPDRHRAEAQDV